MSTCTYCREVPADPGFDRCTACRTWRDEEWCELNGHPHGEPVVPGGKQSAPKP